MVGFVMRRAVALVCVSMSLGFHALTARPAQEAKEPHAARAVAKYKAVFSLIPHRVAQVLRVVGAYPQNNTSNRHDLVTKTVAFLQDKYRSIQLLSSLVANDREKYRDVASPAVAKEYAMLVDTIKKYQTTLISSMSVLDGEASRQRSVRVGELRSRNYNDAAAYASALAVLRPNNIDTVVDALAEQLQSNESESSMSIREELSQLRGHVAQLMKRVTGSASEIEKQHEETKAASASDTIPVVEKDIAALQGSAATGTRATSRTNRVYAYASKHFDAMSAKSSVLAERVQVLVAAWWQKVYAVIESFASIATDYLARGYHAASAYFGITQAVPAPDLERKLGEKPKSKNWLVAKARVIKDHVQEFVCGVSAHIKERSKEAADGAVFVATTAKDTAVAGAETLYTSWADLLNKGYGLLNKSVAVDVSGNQSSNTEPVVDKDEDDAEMREQTIREKIVTTLHVIDMRVRSAALAALSKVGELRDRGMKAGADFINRIRGVAPADEKKGKKEERAMQEDADQKLSDSWVSRLQQQVATIIATGAATIHSGIAATQRLVCTTSGVVQGWWNRLLGMVTTVRSVEAVAD